MIFYQQVLDRRSSTDVFYRIFDRPGTAQDHFRENDHEFAASRCIQGTAHGARRRRGPGRAAARQGPRSPVHPPVRNPLRRMGRRHGQGGPGRRRGDQPPAGRDERPGAGLRGHADDAAGPAELGARRLDLPVSGPLAGPPPDRLGVDLAPIVDRLTSVHGMPNTPPGDPTAQTLAKMVRALGRDITSLITEVCSRRGGAASGEQLRPGVGQSSTRELLRELEVRGEVGRLDEDLVLYADALRRLAELAGQLQAQLPRSVLEYRT